MGEMNILTKRLNSLLKREFERGLSEGYRLGYQAGIVEGRNKAIYLRSQVNQILNEREF